MLLDEFNRKYRVELVKTGKEEFELHTNSNPVHLLMDIGMGEDVLYETTDIIVTDRDTSEIILDQEVVSENQASLLLHNIFSIGEEHDVTRRGYVLITVYAEAYYSKTTIKEYTVLPNWFYKDRLVKQLLSDFLSTYYITFYEAGDTDSARKVYVSLKGVSELELLVTDDYLGLNDLSYGLRETLRNNCETIDREKINRMLAQIEEVSQKRRKINRIIADNG